MPQYRISSYVCEIIGTYEAPTPDAALVAMRRDARAGVPTKTFDGFVEQLDVTGETLKTHRYGRARGQ